MKRCAPMAWLSMFATMIAWTADPAAAQYAKEVVSYDAGSTPAPGGYTHAAAALGSPERFTGDGTAFPGIVSPFSPPYLTDEIVSIGEGGQLTLRLANYALAQPGGQELGVFTNAGLSFDATNGGAASPVATFGNDAANVEISDDGIDWFDLGEVQFNLPTNGYTDSTDPFSSVAGSVASDFQQPFDGAVDDFAGLPYYDGGGTNILDVLGGSGGGTWLDISASGLEQVGYVRFSVADDGNPAAGLNFELDAVSIAHGAVGPATVPEPATVTLLALIPWSMRHCRRSRRE